MKMYEKTRLVTVEKQTKINTDRQ